MEIDNCDLNRVLRRRRYTARPARVADVPPIAEHLRAGDRLELERMYDGSPGEVLAASLRASPLAWTVDDPGGRPVAMWGVQPYPPDTRVGVPWLLGTDAMTRGRSVHLWLSREYDAIMGRYFLMLCNLVDAEYAQAIRWLEWLGYMKGERVKSPKGYDFYLMYRGTAHVR